jgi:hypothetical protein
VNARRFFTGGAVSEKKLLCEEWMPKRIGRLLDSELALLVPSIARGAKPEG